MARNSQIPLQSELAAVEAEIADIDKHITDLRKKRRDLDMKREVVVAKLKAAQTRNQQTDWESQVYPWTKTVDAIRQKMGIASFRHLQLSTINATLGAKDCILIMPTGGGKSLCYQIPAFFNQGLTIVISPLVSLMEDQHISLQKYGIEGAVLNAATGKEQTAAVYQKMLDPNSTLKIVYVTPERIAKTKTFNMRMEACYEAGRLARIVIDEVHCCSQWGHDFRPDYKALNILKRQYPKTPLLGLTATATVRVLEDIQDMLGLQGCMVFRAPFNRSNLFYEVHQKPATAEASINALADLIRHRFEDQSGIVYCLSIKDTEETARDLLQRGIRAKCYHAHLPPDTRSKTHQEWLNNKIHVVVATVAFGMGIDKPDVRFVIHHTLSKSIETFYQESGRAGRDGQTAHCILFYRMQDMFRLCSITFQEKVGEANMRGMVAYAHNISECRRIPLARHFGEEWTPEMCGGMCDICKPKANRKLVTVDVTDMAREALQSVEKAQKKSKTGKCTAVQLLESWLGKSLPKLGNLKMATREECERIIVDLLMNKYFGQTFHATPYSYVSYITLGPEAKHLLKGNARIEIQFNTKVIPKRGGDKPETQTAEPQVVCLDDDDDDDGDADLISAYEAYEESFPIEPPTTDVKNEIYDEDVTPESLADNSHLDLDYGDVEASPVPAVKVELSDEACLQVMKRSSSHDSSGPKKRRGLF